MSIKENQISEVGWWLRTIINDSCPLRLQRAFPSHVSRALDAQPSPMELGSEVSATWLQWEPQGRGAWGTRRPQLRLAVYMNLIKSILAMFSSTKNRPSWRSLNCVPVTPLPETQKLRQCRSHPGSQHSETATFFQTWAIPRTNQHWQWAVEGLENCN